MKAQRESLGWTVENVADQLKLAPRQVVALEEGDFASLPNLAVVRGFVRAYAKVVKLDAAPLVAMIEVNPVPSAEAAPARREISASFSEARFPSMTQRGTKPAVWIAGAVVAAVAAALVAYKLGYISPTLLTRADKDAPAASAPAAAAAPVETTLIKPGQELTPLQTPSVPLISVPAAAGSPSSAPASASPNTPASAPAAEAPVPAAAPVAAATGDALVLTVTQDSWVEIRRARGAPLISRTVKAGSTETFNITEPVQLVVGKPAGVEASLRGAKLELTPVPGGTTSRLSIK
ncbi:helix-turn-helix domain-containing protein [Janthinobacterium sp.]|uniref:helix-turn-helix domain-containing protein n=1 Tax=Janthinobacterium sp. TaxID=1871054 RepID=UPI00293DA096|nr:helix-turn-helix domain-containing protein [Janthinobacterium sp.]